VSSKHHLCQYHYQLERLLFLLVGLVLLVYSSGLADKLNLDTYLLGESLPGVPVTDGIEMAYFPKLALTSLTGNSNKVSATTDPKNGNYFSLSELIIAWHLMKYPT
jgi:hypothetical protein